MSTSKDVEEKNDAKNIEAVRHYVPVPTDGGYGWIICVTSFFFQMICDGLIFSFGVIFVHLLDHFRESRSMTSWVGSLLLGMCMFNGPVAGALSKVFGFRQVAFAGSIIATSGMLASSFVPNIPTMILTMGFIGGFGISLPYLISMVMVGSYFEKRRSLANGIALCGSGVGAFVFSPLLEYLLSIYSWQGTFIVLAGIMLQGCICGALFRPPPIGESSHCVKQFTSRSSRMNEGNPNENDVRLKNSDTIIRTNDEIRVSLCVNDAVLKNGQTLTPLHLSKAYNHTSKQSVHAETCLLSAGRLKTSSLHDLNAVNRLKHRIFESTISGSDARLFHRPNGELYKSVQYLGFQEPRTLFRSHIAMTASSLSMIMKAPPGGKAWVDSMTCTSDHSKADLEKHSADDITWCEIVKRKFYFFVWSLGLPLLKEPVCVLIIASSILWTGQAAVFTYLVDFARFKGIGSYEAAFLLSIIGIMNLIGRIAFGWLTDFPRVDSVIMYTIGLVLAAVSNIAIPFCSSYAAFAACAALFGLAMSAYVSLRSIIVVDLLGLEHLTHGLGLVIMFQGLANMVVPSISGAILDMTGSYTALFMLSGFFYFLSAFAILPVKFIKTRVVKLPTSGL
ncbi:monocarboxylate transporter 12-like isoform X4 [Tubulanus polymorphus]